MSYPKLYTLLLIATLPQTNDCYSMDLDPENSRKGGMKRLRQLENSPSDITRDVPTVLPHEPWVTPLTCGAFAPLPCEVSEKIIAISPIEVRALNTSFYFLATGYASPNALGPEILPLVSDRCFGNPKWTAGSLNFSTLQVQGINISLISSAAWYRLCKHVYNLPITSHSYLKGTNAKTLVLAFSQVSDDEAEDLQLQGTKIRTLDLAWNQIGNKGIQKLNLQGTHVHSLDLTGNQIGDAGAKGMHLQNTHVRRINMSQNKISKETQAYLQTTYPTISFEF